MLKFIIFALLVAAIWYAFTGARETGRRAMIAAMMRAEGPFRLPIRLIWIQGKVPLIRTRPPNL